jgi:hypothetical protein
MNAEWGGRRRTKEFLKEQVICVMIIMIFRQNYDFKTNICKLLISYLLALIEKAISSYLSRLLLVLHPALIYC